MTSCEWKREDDSEVSSNSSQTSSSDKNNCDNSVPDDDSIILPEDSPLITNLDNSVPDDDSIILPEDSPLIIHKVTNIQTDVGIIAASNRDILLVAGQKNDVGKLISVQSIMYIPLYGEKKWTRLNLDVNGEPVSMEFSGGKNVEFSPNSFYKPTGYNVTMQYENNNIVDSLSIQPDMDKLRKTISTLKQKGNQAIVRLGCSAVSLPLELTVDWVKAGFLALDGIGCALAIEVPGMAQLACGSFTTNLMKFALDPSGTSSYPVLDGISSKLGELSLLGGCLTNLSSSGIASCVKNYGTSWMRNEYDKNKGKIIPEYKPISLCNQELEVSQKIKMHAIYIAPEGNARSLVVRGLAGVDVSFKTYRPIPEKSGQIDFEIVNSTAYPGCEQSTQPIWVELYDEGAWLWAPWPIATTKSVPVTFTLLASKNELGAYSGAPCQGVIPGSDLNPIKPGPDGYN